MIGHLRRLRRREDGQSLVLVMLIGTLTMLMLGTASMALVSQIRPSGNSVDAGAALAAAEAGIEDFVATVNTKCPPTDGSFYCGWLATGVNSKGTVADPKNDQGTVLVGGDGNGTRESFYWKVSFGTSGFARVTSTGQVPTGKASPKYRTKVLVADVNASPSFNNFQYYTKYETYAPDFVNSFYGPRTVQVTDKTGSSLSGPGTLNWTGTCTYIDATTTPSCDPNHDTSICDDLYYPSDAGPGRGTDAKWNNVLRRPGAATQTAMGTDNTFGYYAEQGTFAPTSGSSVAETHNDTCDASFEPNMIMSGPIYSEDAYLIDRGKDTGKSGNSMPVFTDFAYSMWNGVINGAQQAAGINGGYDRAYPTTDGQISTTINPTPTLTTQKLELPANGSSSKSLAACTYIGPTRILIKQNIAYITSPGTPTSPAPSGPAYCYASTGTFANATGGGVADAQVPIDSTLIYVQNPASGTPSPATRTSPVFNLSASTPAPATAALTDTLAGTWTDDASYSATATCPSPTDPTKRRNFDCEANSAKPDMLAAIKNAVDTALQGPASSASDMQAKVTAALTPTFAPAAILSPPNPWTTSNYYYKVTVSSPTYSSTTTTAPAMSPADAFYQSTSSGSFTTQLAGATVSIDRMTCSSPKSNGSCNVALTDTPLITGSATGRYVTGSAATASASFPWFGAQTGANTYTDMNNDVTQYANGYGDAYVEGQLKGNMSIVSEHDIVVTNDITYNNATLNTTTDGLALVANHNVRIYRPMTCTDDGTAGATTGGYCPNDLTGVYNTALSWPLPNNYPSLKYKPDSAPSMTNTGQGNLYATVFTLRGSFMVDNFYRGDIGSNANVYGGLYQYHRGPTSLPYQGRPFQGSTTKMPGILINYTYDNMRAGQTANGGLRVPWFPTPVERPTGSPRTWNVNSISTGT